MATILKSFEKWQSFLGDRIKAAERVGINDQTLVNLATEIGGYLSDKIDPENAEERLLKDMWEAGDEQERKSIASVMVKLAKAAK
ncbi:DUF3243 domain-containing protein [Gorillibacterium timonense]|uniref:DUF3243 domain-containing protein n=1 Tax=Gorillibacterium timonense TaxID=1689269 RepID=UPI00071DBFA9|nr:DUF3243 domain-containing protein [Gorillibacterium timonense]